MWALLSDVCTYLFGTYLPVALGLWTATLQPEAGVAALIVVLSVLWCCCAPMPFLVEFFWRPYIPTTKDGRRRRLIVAQGAPAIRLRRTEQRMEETTEKDQWRFKATKACSIVRSKGRLNSAAGEDTKVELVALQELSDSEASDSFMVKDCPPIQGASWSSTDSDLVVVSPPGHNSSKTSGKHAKAVVSSRSGNNKDQNESGKKRPALITVLYSERYDISAFGLERLHPFDSTKYKRVIEELVRRRVLSKPDEHLAGAQVRWMIPPVLPRAFLVDAHSWRYLASLHSSLALLRILEVPPVALLPAVLVRWRVLYPMLYQCGGTIAATEIALSTGGMAINIGGGFHHASFDSGGGFCPFADISMACRHARSFEGVQRVLIVDLDAHQGNGHERDSILDEQTFVFDFYNASIYPADSYAKQGIDFDYGLDYYDSTDDAYLHALQSLSSAIDAVDPDFIIYNAGTDCLEGDPLGCMQLTEQGIIERDRVVFEIARKRSRPIPLIMLLSGGYQQSNAPVIARSIESLVRESRLW